jgi:dolichyl-phosphate-mannose-protein mannosyltransferase
MRKNLWLMMVLFMLLPHAALAENLLANPGFESAADGVPSGWQRDMWLHDEGVSLLTLEGDAHEGQNCARIISYSQNDARFKQSVRVEPATLYKISGWIKAQDVSLEGDGAGLSIEDTFTSTELVYDTQGQWAPVELYGTTGEDQTELVVMARLGGYGAPNTGIAWFDGLSMEKADRAPVGADVYSLARLEDSGSMGAADFDDDAPWDDGAEPADRGALYLVLVGVLTAAAMAAGVWRIGGGALSGADEGSLRRGLWAAMAAGLVVRVVVAVIVRGYGVDMGCFQGWSARMLSTGPSGFYSADVFCDYPPGYMYVLWLIGALRSAFGLGYDARLTWLLIKLPSILLDIAAAYLIYREGREALGQRAASLLAGGYALLPAAILNSAAWGQIDAVLAILVALAVIDMSKQRYERALPLFGAAIMIKPQALLFAPIGVAAIIVEIVRSRDKGAQARRLAKSFGLMLLVMLGIALPFLINLPADLIAESSFASALPGFLQPVGWLISLFAGTLESYGHMTVNACNLYALLDMNWTPLESEPFWRAFSIAMMALSYAYAVFLYVRGKKRGRLMLVCATLLSLVFALGPKMHERYLFPALLLLALSYGVDRDFRVLIALIALPLTQFLNAGLVLRSEHLIDAEQTLNAAISVVNLLAAGLMAWTAFDICVRDRVISITRRYRPNSERSLDTDPLTNPVAESLFRPKEWKLVMKKRDWLLMLALTILYAAVALPNLGTMAAPQTSWKSTAEGEQITFDLGSLRQFHMTYYGGISTAAFTVQLSEDEQVWSEARWANYNQGEIFRWLWYQPGELDENGAYSKLESGNPMQNARYVRLTAERAGLILSEVAFLDEEGAPYPIASVYAAGAAGDRAGDPNLLIDEQDTVPPYPSYYNGTYFDEIYHARTAYEHREGLHAYEYTHPPLGKVLIMVGINLFGMTPFGWRIMGALFGVLMIPAMYMLAKQLLRRSSPAFLAAFLMAVDCMHFTQSRIATIDVFAVFFIIVMYLFMLRYIMMSFNHVRLWRTLVPLFFCGLFMGFAIASKWIGVYAGAGLAILLFYSVFLRAREYVFARCCLKQLEGDQRRIAQRAVNKFWRNLSVTLIWCVVFFIIIPILIYYFSYYWHLAPDGNFTPAGVIDMQESMFSYHAGLGDDTHFFRSPWYEWPLIIKPMWYYSGNEYMPEGYISSISCMGNPAVWWGGLLALLFVIARFFSKDFGDKRYLFVMVGFLSQYLPWILVPRSTFIYHYFASVPFIILATAAFFEWLRRVRPGAYRRLIWLHGAVALMLFIAFYPLMSGTPCLRVYANLLRWFGWYNF